MQLTDEFGTVPSQVLNIAEFCNPVAKIHNGVLTDITNPDSHLTFYRLVSPIVEPTRVVGVVNQFGTNQLVIGDAILLGVPTQKLPFGPPSGLDHFKCYTAQGSPANATVDLRDQFHFEPQVVVLNPDWYCNPVQKIHNGQVFPITDPQDHLVCYLINQQPPFAFNVNINNQFGPDGFVVHEAHHLCVPTGELPPTPTPLPTESPTPTPICTTTPSGVVCVSPPPTPCPAGANCPTPSPCIDPACVTPTPTATPPCPPLPPTCETPSPTPTATPTPTVTPTCTPGTHLCGTPAPTPTPTATPCTDPACLTPTPTCTPDPARPTVRISDANAVHGSRLPDADADSHTAANAARPLQVLPRAERVFRNPGIPLTLIDQFESQDVLAQVAREFCNPVTKIHNGVLTGITNPASHLTFYSIIAPQGPDPTRIVDVQNQFGPQTLTVTNPILLGVPSQKDTEPPPSGLDHFKCYQATGNPVNAVVDLIDQFHFEPGVAVLNPDWFCNPTEKIHNGQDFPITDPVDHLVCYLINPQPPFQWPERDQSVRQRELLREPGGSLVRAESEARLHHPDAGPHRHAGSDALFRRDLPDADSLH